MPYWYQITGIPYTHEACFFWPDILLRTVTFRKSDWEWGMVVLYICAFLYDLNFFLIWSYTLVFLLVALWVFLLSLCFFMFKNHLQVHPHDYKWPNFVPFYGWVIFHCIYVSHFLYPFICRYTFRLLNRWKDKEDVVHIYNGILLSHKKERNWVICSHVDEPRVCHRVK